MSQAGLLTSTPGGGSISGVATTVGAVTADVITLPLGPVPGNYTFTIKVSSFEPTTPLGASYTIAAGVRTTGAAAVLIPNQVPDEMEEAASIPEDAEVIVAGNTMIVRVTGLAALTVNWGARAEYIFRS